MGNGRLGGVLLKTLIGTRRLPADDDRIELTDFARGCDGRI